MATWDDVRREVADLPETSEGQGPGWGVHGKPLAWDRPLRAKDREALGSSAPEGPVLCARVPGLQAKDELIARLPDVYFTTPHFRGYPAILVRLDVIDVPELRDLLTEAWLAQAPKRLAAQWLAAHPDGPT
ncbi:MAG: MmcQ/YjbR family DNA-binding protein [Cellulomonas sp.]